MRQSANNPKIEYSTNWRYALEVLGKGRVCEKDLDRQGDKPGDRAWTGEYTGVEFTKGITEVGPGFLEAFPALQYIIIHYNVQSIAVTPQLKALLKKNHVLVRGWYDSFGERFAREHGLKFIHADIEVGWAHDEEHYTNTRMEIRFDDKGKPYAFYDDICPGISAGNNGGGTYTQDIPEDFYKGETLESFAEWKKRFRNDILKNKDLAYFLKTANKRGK